MHSPLFDVKSATVVENDVENEMSGNLLISSLKMGFFESRIPVETRRVEMGYILLEIPPFFNKK